MATKNFISKKKKINDGYKVGFYAGGYSLAWKLRKKIYFFLMEMNINGTKDG